MPKRGLDESTAGASPSGIVNLNILPEPAADGRKTLQVLQKEQLEEALADLKTGWPGGDVEEFHFDPLKLSLKWKATEVKLLDAALSSIGATLRVLDLTPRGCNSVLTAAISSTIVSQCTRVQHLRVTEIPFAAETISALGTLTELHELALGGIAVNIRAPLALSGLGSLHNCKELHTLHVEQTDLGDDALVEIVQGCTQLTDVDLSSCKELTGRGISALAKASTNLTKLSLPNCEQVGPNGIRALLGCTKLRELNLRRVRGATASLEDVCQGCRGLQNLDLSCCFLTDEDVAAIAGLSCLEVLDLNGTSGYGAAALQDSIPKIRTLQDLSLNGVSHFPAPALDAIVTALGHGGYGSALTKLDLNNTDVSEEAVAGFRAALKTCSVSTINCKNVPKH